MNASRNEIAESVIQGRIRINVSCVAIIKSKKKVQNRRILTGRRRNITEKHFEQITYWSRERSAVNVEGRLVCDVTREWRTQCCSDAPNTSSSTPRSSWCVLGSCHRLRFVRWCAHARCATAAALVTSSRKTLVTSRHSWALLSLPEVARSFSELPLLRPSSTLAFL